MDFHLNSTKELWDIIEDLRKEGEYGCRIFIKDIDVLKLDEIETIVKKSGFEVVEILLIRDTDDARIEIRKI